MIFQTMEESRPKKNQVKPPAFLEIGSGIMENLGSQLHSMNQSSLDERGRPIRSRASKHTNSKSTDNIFHIRKKSEKENCYDTQEDDIHLDSSPTPRARDPNAVPTVKLWPPLT